MKRFDWRSARSPKQRSRPRRRFANSFGQRLMLEPLEDRHLLSVNFNPITGPDTGNVFNIDSGKTLYVPLTSTDAGQTISYAATSSNPNVKVSVLTGNPTLSMNVSGTDANNNAFSGTITMQLFQNLAPNTVSIIEGLVNNHTYDGQSFYRVVPNFVIQGGVNPTTAGSTFNDEFNVALSFDSPGILAMANRGANTNSTEIFVSDIGLPSTQVPTFLNYGYTIFGQLTSGFDIYNEIMNAKGVTANNSSPSPPVIINSASIITDTQNGVVAISEPNNFTGTATITVTATGSDTTTGQQAFTVSAAPLTQTSQNHPLLLAPVTNVTTTASTSITLQLAAGELHQGNPVFTVTSSTGFTGTPTNVTVQVTPNNDGTATVKLTPAAGFLGSLSLVAHVDDATLGIHDAESFVLSVMGITNFTGPVNASNQSAASISGTGQAGTTVTVTVSDGATTTVPQNATVGTDGTWSISGINVSTLSDGQITYTATSTDSGNHTTTATKNTTKDILPPAVAISSADNIKIANATSASASGTGEIGASISLTVTDGTHTTAPKTATVDANGNWTVSGIDTSTLTDGPIAYNVVATDTAGNTAPATKNATKDTIAPVVAITNVSNPVNIGNFNAASANGTSETGSTVSITVTDGTHTTAAQTFTIQEGTAWSFNALDLSSLDDGTITYTVSATDVAGNTGQSTQTATKTTVKITTLSGPINSANQANQSASGTGEVGASISLVVSDGTTSLPTLHTTVGENGAWSISNIDVTTLGEGTITFTASATDTSPNTATSVKTTVKDTIPPSISVSTVTSPVNNANATNTTATGTTDAGIQVTVVASDGTHSSTPKTATADSNGHWTVTGIDVSGLTDGTITYTATATDQGDNTGTGTKTTSKDTVAPALAISTVTNPINLANTNSAAASGTGEIGANISLTVTDGTHTTTAQTTTVDANGNWSITGINVGALNDGTLTFQVTASDTAGNTTQKTSTSTKQTVTLTSVTNRVSKANQTNTTASGTGQSGATISVTVTDGTHTTNAVTTTVGSNGTWSVSGINVSSLNDGVITYHATATLNSNSGQSTLTSSKDATAPGVAINTTTNPITTANVTNTTASGTGEPGASISLVVSDGTHTTSAKTTTVNSSGAWSISGLDLSALNDGTLTYTVTTTDAVNNSSQATATANKAALNTASLSGFVFVDSNSNSAKDATDPVLAGVLMTLTGVNAQGAAIPSQTATTAADGSYQFTNLPAGTYTIAESQPPKLSNGGDTAGSAGGSQGANAVSNIVLATGAVGTNYNFSEEGLAPSMISMRLLLASAPPVQQLFNTVVATGGATAPLVTSMVRSDGDASNAQTLHYAVSFNESVSGVNTSDFVLAAAGGVSGATVQSVSGNGSSYTVTIDRGTGTGTLGLSLVDDDTIVDASSIALGGAGAGNGNFTGPAYTITSGAASQANAQLLDAAFGSNDLLN